MRVQRKSITIAFAFVPTPRSVSNLSSKPPPIPFPFPKTTQAISSAFYVMTPAALTILLPCPGGDSGCSNGC
ncbi:hypothetical protein PILCRDRAFT_830272 [Piloderma croceum F 1598]|uniref:Uncharacterized protein n=1 Tax=Piloderma croceum (strain F 1598) TaxID=765440 RepID=A0A0C3EFZ5_PILCF|nr:hypothetical protein PILCRDRAFT_830272 [Piloderma croceum F 1598]